MNREIKVEDIYKKPTQEQRRERAKRKGSFFKCLDRDTLCECIDNAAEMCCRQHEGKCCILDDPEYIAHTKKVKENLAAAAKREKEEKHREKMDPPAPVRNQTRTSAEEIDRLIENKKELARRYYRRGKTRIGDSIMQEVMELYAKTEKNRRKQRQI